MSERIDQGGYVFPFIHQDSENPDAQQFEVGITRRDWLAALAMQGITASASDSHDSMHPTTALEIARSAYHLADIMIKVSREDESKYRLPHDVSAVSQTTER